MVSVMSVYVCVCKCELVIRNVRCRDLVVSVMSVLVCVRECVFVIRKICNTTDK